MIALTSLSAGAVLAWTLAALLVPQVALTLWFVWIVRSRTRDFVARDAVRHESATVPAEVILCLRGCDPTLDDVFAALARQSHRAWRLRVVVDSVDDPAWPVAQAAISRLAADGGAAWGGHMVEPLAVRPTRGSLKCASLRQALRSLAPETRVVALIDADSVVHPDWLLTMVDECLRPGVGAVSGNRWYDPDHDSPPGVVRALWNAGAIVQMTTFGIPWGGSLAVRREAMDACGWADVIESTLCEDTALAEPLTRAGWAYRFVPALTAIDRDDDIAFGPLTRWIARQLLTARLHHPAWPLVAMHGVSTSLALAAAVIAACGAWVTGRHASLTAIGGALLGYEAASVALFVVIASSIRAATAVAGKHIAPLSMGRLLWWAALIPAAQCVYAAATYAAATTKSIEWRGVVYRIQPPASSRRDTGVTRTTATSAVIIADSVTT
jgi:hypothetical protein